MNRERKHEEEKARSYALISMPKELSQPLKSEFRHRKIGSEPSTDDSFISEDDPKVREQSFRTLRSEDEISNKNKKPKLKMANLRRFMRYTFSEWRLFLLGNVFLLLTTSTSIYIPYLSGQLLDTISKENDENNLNEKGILFLAICSTTTIAVFFRSLCFNLMSERVTVKMKNEVFSKIVNNDIEFFDCKKTGELISRLDSDIATVKWSASGNFSELLRNLIACIGSFALLFSLSWKLTLITLGIVPVFAGAAVVYSRYSTKLKKIYQDIIADSSIIAEECFSNIRTVKSFSSEDVEEKHFQLKMNEAYKIGKRDSLLMGFFFSFLTFTVYAAILSVLWFGGHLVQQKELTLGQLASFIMYSLWMGGSTTGVSHSISALVTATGVMERLFEIMDYQPRINSKGGSVIPTDNKFKGEIEFQNVDFFYPSKPEVKVLDNFSLKIKAGEVVALAGISGGGKSTVISLLERFYDPTSGEILIDGTNIKDFQLKMLHQKIGFVAQEPVLFSGTIEENICYGLDSYSYDELIHAVKLSNAFEFIHDKHKFPQGFKTLVGERGVKLSGGQKQRVAIARALVKKPKILIFDEATSALDAESEYQVQASIEKLMNEGNMTLIIIAHRLSTIINCGRIIVLCDGKIAEEGKHSDLIKKSGVYKNLIERQMQNFEENKKL
jgi:ATP-binding cassette, subfamily B (MDR/TAP), member 9